MRTSYEITKIIDSSINRAKEQGALDNFKCPDILVQKPKSDLHGTWSTNIALVISKIVKKNPMEIAEIIKSNIQTNKIISQINIMKPGFINIEVSDIYRAEIINKVIKADDKFGSNNFGNKEKVQIEFVSVNPTGPVHVGHARGAVVGSCLANILTFSDYDVTREYYVNDAGTQIDLYVKSILYHIYSKFNLKFDNPKDGYKGEFIENIADEIINEFNIIKDPDILSDRKKFYQKVKKTSLKNTISRIENDLRDLGVEYDKWFYESSLFNDVTNKVLSILESKKLLYQKEGAKWFKASNFFTDQDVVIERSDDSGHTYFFTDMSYHYDKFQKRRFEKVINIFGADHHSHVNRLKSAVSAMDIEVEKLNILLTQIVHFKNQEKIEKFSKRSGNIYSIRDLIDIVGSDSIRFNFLNRTLDSQQEFDLDLAVKQSNENPVYYVQYAHARLCSIINSADMNIQDANLSLLSTKYEKKLIDNIDFFEDIIVHSVENLETHNITQFSIDLAKDLQIFYENCRVLSEDKELTNSRLSLVLSCKIVLCNLLNILGVNAPERM